MGKTIKFTKGDSYAGYVTIDDINQALDAAFFTIKENSDDKPLIQKKLGAGISLADNRLYKQQLSYKFQLDGFDTVNLEIGTRYLYDFKGLIGNVQKTLISGELILSATQTGYITPSEVSGDTPVEETFNATLSIGAQSQYIETEVDPVALAKIGDITELTTTAKDNVVDSINELSQNYNGIMSGVKQVAKAKQADHSETATTANSASKAYLATYATNAINIFTKNGDYKKLADALLEMIYPVGSIKLTTENENPSTYLGGKWEAWGAGRVPVGVDETKTIFKTAEKTGGSETATLPYHTHDAVLAFNGPYGVDAYDGGDSSSLTPKAQGEQGGGYVITISRDDNRSDLRTGGTKELKTGAAGVSSASNLQPYITCYMWKRTA